MAYRKFDTGAWTDKRFERLNPLERYLFIYLWTNEHCTQAGMYEITLRRIEFETKIPAQEVEAMLKGMAGMVTWWPAEEVVFIPNFMKRQCQNKEFARKALSAVMEDFPAFLPVFLKANGPLLERHGLEVPPQGGSTYLEPHVEPSVERGVEPDVEPGVEPPVEPPHQGTFASPRTETEQNRAEQNYVCPELRRTSGPPPDVAEDSGSEKPPPRTTEAEPERPDPVVIKIPLAGKAGDYAVKQSQVDEWQSDFPGVDIRQELRELRQWNKASPKRRKTARGILRHITGWLAREQDRAGSGRHPPGGGRYPPRGGNGSGSVATGHPENTFEGFCRIIVESLKSEGKRLDGETFGLMCERYGLKPDLARSYIEKRGLM